MRMLCACHVHAMHAVCTPCTPRAMPCAMCHVLACSRLWAWAARSSAPAMAAVIATPFVPEGVRRWPPSRARDTVGEALTW